MRNLKRGVDRRCDSESTKRNLQNILFLVEETRGIKGRGIYDDKEFQVSKLQTEEGNVSIRGTH